MPQSLIETSPSALPVRLIGEADLTGWLQTAPAPVANWVKANGFKAKGGTHCLIPDSDGGLSHVLCGFDGKDDLFGLAHLVSVLPGGDYCLADEPDAGRATQLSLGWALAAYRFDRYGKAVEKPFPRLVWPASADRREVTRLAEATYLARDLINTPAADMGPEDLAAAAASLAQRFQANCSAIVGDDLLAARYPMVHAVGRASTRAPRLVDLHWGHAGHPRVTLVGKGVCFDSGGLDLKTSAGMALMKKDMGGAATVMALAHAIMDAGLKLRLRVLLPIVENAVSGNAFRPGDVLMSRAGIAVEIGNTDAEGRLILADALCEADAEKPDLIIDMATLTGAARVALGPELPALFSSDDALASDVLNHGRAWSDPLWQLPLHAPYRDMLKSNIADINNAGEGGFAGAITAALFLRDFVRESPRWMHIDTYAWNGKGKAGRPQGGEALCLRALYAFLKARYGQQ